MERDLKDSVSNEVDFEMVLNQLALEKFVKKNPEFKALKSLDSDIMESLRACGDCEGGGCDCNSSSRSSDISPVSLRYDSKDIMESLRACGDCEGGGCDCNSSSCGSDISPVSLKYKTEKKYNHLN